jgi:hypothetical protein
MLSTPEALFSAAVAQQTVMRSRWRWLGAAIIVVLLIPVTLGLLGSSSSKPGKLYLEAATFTSHGESLVISVLTSNAGSTVLVNGGNCDVRYQMDGLWSTNSLPGYRSSISWLLPGQVRTQHISLPRRTSRFQVGAGYEVAHGRVATVCRLYSSPLPHVISGLLASALRPLPYRPGPYVEFWDDEHDIQAAAN